METPEDAAHPEPSGNGADPEAPAAGEAPPLAGITTVRKGPGFWRSHRKWLRVGGIVAGALLLACLGVRGCKAVRKRRAARRAAPVATPAARPADGFSGARAFVKEHIDRSGGCRIVSITRTGGDVVVCDRNDWASSGCPKPLNAALQSVVNDGDTITDVTLTESGRWLVLFGRNSARWMGIPPSMERDLRQYNRNDEKIYSATFNDSGDWIVITEDHYSCSAGFITDWLRNGARKYGVLRSACICGPDAVAVFDRGFLFWGNIPEDLKKALRETEIDVRILKIAGMSWFFADDAGSFQYRM